MTDLLHARVPDLEKDFLVIDYDQRGAGLSYRPTLDPETMTLAQFVEDAAEVRKQVLNRMHLPGDTKVYVLGHSMGTMIALDLVAKYPHHYAAYIGVGQVVQIAENEQYSYDFALSEAHRTGNRAAVEDLECVGRPSDEGEYDSPGTNPACNLQADGFAVTNHWMSYFGGDVYGQRNSESVENVIFSTPAYENARAHWHAGFNFSQAFFSDPHVTSWDARILHRAAVVPLYFFVGRHDYDTPAPLAEAYVSIVRGEHAIVWFEDSAHFPFFEEPALFRRKMLEVRDRTVTQVGH